MSRRAMFMETTTVPAARSIASIEDCLIRAGATGIMKQYGPSATPGRGGPCVSLRFALRVGGHECPFQLPARVEPVFKRLKQQRTHRSRQSDNDLRESADRIAWRQLFRWVEAQVALIDTGMVSPAEPFFAYRWDPQGGRTMFEVFQDSQLLLPAGDTQ